MKLTTGQFYGARRNQRTVSGFALNEVRYGSNLVLPRHTHEAAYFSFVWQGGYEEQCGHYLRECGAATAVFHPAGEAHADRFSDAGGHLLNLEISPWLLESVEAPTVSLKEAAYFREGAILELGLKLCKAISAPDGAPAPVIQDLGFEILAELCESKRPARTEPPRWLASVTDMLRAHFNEPLSLAVIADAVGFHPVHVARIFRKCYRCSVHQYLERLRIGYTCRQIAQDSMPLSDIALAAGFCDQSHFSKTFKRSTGMTPAEFRTRVLC